MTTPKDQLSKEAQSFFDSFKKELALYMEYDDEQDETKKLELARKIIGDNKVTDIDEADERIREIMGESSECVHYQSTWYNRYNYFEIMLVGGWPNIRLKLNDRFDTAELVFHRWGEHAYYNDFTNKEAKTLMRIYNKEY